MTEPTIQIRRTVAAKRDHRSTLALAALFSLLGGTAGALWGLWSLRDEGRGFRFAQPIEAPRRARHARATLETGATLEESALPALRVRAIREYLGAAGSGGASVNGATASGRGAVGSILNLPSASDAPAERGVASRGSREYSTAYAAALAPGRPLGAKAKSASVRRLVAAAATPESRVFRSDSGTGWRLVASHSASDAPTDLRDAPNGETSELTDETTVGRRGAGREATDVVKLGKIREAGDGREIAGLESAALMSRLDDESRREVLRVLEDRAEHGINPLAACQQAKATAACLEAMRLCTENEACRRRYLGR